MNARAILWCGYVEPRRERDFQWSMHDLQIAHDSLKQLGLSETNIYALVGQDDLLPQGFGGTSAKATLAALQNVLNKAKQSRAPLIFVATNHGFREGLALTPAPLKELGAQGNKSGHQGRRVLTPGHLRETLKTWAGPQVLVIAACYAGIFLELGDPERRIVMATCKGDELYRLEDQEPPHSVFVGEFFRHWCDSQKASPEAAFEKARANIVTLGYGHLPLKSGSVAWP